MDIFEVKIADPVKDALKRMPKQIALKLLTWVDNVREDGLRVVRKLPGFHDEPVQGEKESWSTLDTVK